MALVAEAVAPDADDAGEKGQKIQEQKNRQHDKTIRKGRDASQRPDKGRPCGGPIAGMLAVAGSIVASTRPIHLLCAVGHCP